MDVIGVRRNDSTRNGKNEQSKVCQISWAVGARTRNTVTGRQIIDVFPLLTESALCLFMPERKTRSYLSIATSRKTDRYGNRAYYDERSEVILRETSAGGTA